LGIKASEPIGVGVLPFAVAGANDPVGIVEAVAVDLPPGATEPASSEIRLRSDFGNRTRVSFFLTSGTDAVASLYVDEVLVVDSVSVVEAADRPFEKGVTMYGTPFRFGSVVRLVVSRCGESSGGCGVAVQLEADP
jgi:hypothetical protein